MPAQPPQPNNNHELTRNFEGWLTRQNLSPASVRNYVSDINGFLEWLANLPLPERQFTSQVIDQYRQHLVKIQKPLTSANRSLSSLRRFGTYLAEANLAAQDPTLDLRNITQEELTTPPPRQSLTQQFAHSLAREQLAEATIKNYVSDVNQFFAWLPQYEQGVDLQGFTPQLITQFRQYLRVDLQVVPASIDRKISSLRRFFAWAKKEGLIAQNPLAGEEKRPKLPPLLLGDRWMTPEKAQLPEEPFLEKLKQRWQILALSGIGLLLILLLLLFHPWQYLPEVGVQEPSTSRTRQLVIPTPNPQAVVTTLASHPWIVSFQGKLTSAVTSQPLIQPATIIFTLYSSETDVTPLWTSKEWELAPDQDGNFYAPLGDATRGDNEIPSRIFFLHDDLFLAANIEGSELKPRTRISTAANSANAYLLEEHPPQEETGVGGIPVIDSAGALTLAAPSPKIKALNDTFAIEGQAITITTPFASDGDITLQPDGSGTVKVLGSNQSGNTLSVTNANLVTGALISAGLGSSLTTPYLLSLSAGASPSAKFTVDAGGNMVLAGSVKGQTELRLADSRASALFSDSAHTTLPGGATSILGALHLAYGTTGTATSSSTTSPWTDGGDYLYPTNKESVRIYDSGGTDYVQFKHDGTTLAATGVSTSDVSFHLPVVLRDTTTFEAKAYFSNLVRFYNTSTDPSNIGEGSLYYNTTNDVLRVYTGAGWIDVGSSLWTDGGAITYLTSTSDDLALGGTTSAAPFFMDVSAGDLTITGDITVSGGGITGANSESISLGETDNVITFTSGAATRATINAAGNFGIEGNLYDITDATLTIDDNLSVTGDVDINGNDITSASDLTINPDAAADIYFHSASYSLSDTGDFTLGGRVTFENSEFIDNETDGSLIFNDPTGNTLTIVLNDTNPVIQGSTTQVNVNDALAIEGNLSDITDTTLTIDDDLALTDGNVLAIGGVTATTYNAMADSGGAASATTVGNDNDLYVQGTLESSEFCIGSDCISSWASVTGQWENTANALHPKQQYASVVDVLVGSSATNSATVRLPGLPNQDAFFNLGTGNVGIGDTTPDAKFEVVGDVMLNNNVYFGNATSEVINWDGSNFSVSDDWLPSAADTSNLGATTAEWNSLYMADGSGVAAGGGVFFGSSQDFLVTYDAASSNALELSDGTNTFFGITDQGLTADFGFNINTLFVKSDGNVGIGTTTPTAKLDIVGDASTSGSLVFRGATPATIDILNGARFDFQTADGGDLGLAPVVSILNNGNVGIGTTTPSELLEVAGKIELANNLLAGGITGVDYNAMSDAGGASNRGLASDNDLYIQDDLEVDSIGYFDDQICLQGSCITSWAGGAGLWENNDNAFHPREAYASVVDVLVGSSATVSATVRLPGLPNQDAFFNLGTGNVGIGTTTPSAKLDIVGDLEVNGYATISSSLAVGYTNAYAGPGNAVLSGKVGIGTTSPEAPLHISGGSAGAISAVSYAGLVLEDNTINNYIHFQNPNTADAGFVWGDTDDNDVAWFYYDHDDNFFKSKVAGVASRFATNSLVGIGTTNPETYIHTFGGSAGTITVPAFASLVLEDDVSSNYIDFQNANDQNAGFVWSDPDDNDVAWFYYDHADNFFKAKSGGTTDLFAFTGDASTSGSLVFRGTTPATVDILNGSRLDFQTSDGGDLGLAPIVSILNNGNVGIGTTTPSELLEVAGKLELANNLLAGGIIGVDYNAMSDSGGASSRGLASDDDLYIQADLEVDNIGYFDNQICLQGDCISSWSGGGAGLWQNNANAFHPREAYASVVDVLVGSTATISARVRLPGLDNQDAFFNLGTGNLGIGTTTPGIKLQVAGDIAATAADTYSLGSTTLEWNSLYAADGSGLTAGGGLFFGSDQDFLLTYDAATSNALELSDGTNTFLGVTDQGLTADFGFNTNTLFVTSGGNVGIGTTTPTAKLDVVGDASASGSLVFRGSTPATVDILNGARLDLQTSDGGDLGLAPVVSILNNGNVGIGTTTPAEKVNLAGGNFLHTAVGNPTLKGTYSAGGNQIFGVYVSGKYAYVADANSGTLTIVDISNPASPTSIGSVALFAPQDVFVAGMYAYVADATAGLRVIDITNPASPSLIGTYDTGSSALDVYVSGKYAYVADDGDGLYVIDVTDPTTPALTGSLDTSGQALGVYVFGKYTYLAAGAAGLQLINISNPASPSLTGTYDSGGTAYAVYVSGKYAYLADGASGLDVVNVGTDPTTPTSAGSYNTGDNADGVYVSGKYAYVADDGDGLYVINVSNPASPSLVGTYDTSNNAEDVFVSGKYAYVADNSGGMHIIDINGAETPALYAGNIQTNDITATENIDVGNNLYVRNGLNVGPGGLLVDAGEVGIDSNSADTALRLLQRGSGDIVNVSNSSTEVFTILNDGNVGIGNTTPRAKLDVAGDASTSGSLVFRGSSPATIDILNGARLDFQTSDGGDLGLAPVMTILNSGRVGIGTTSIDANLDIEGVTNAELYIEETSSSVRTKLISSTSNGAVGTVFDDPFAILTNNTNRIWVKADGNVGIGTTTPTSFLHVAADFTGGWLTKLHNTSTNGLTADGLLIQVDRDGATALKVASGSANLLSVSTALLQADVPASFSAQGDVAIANDLWFTDLSANYIKSDGNLYIEAGDAASAENLYLRSAGTGDVVVGSGTTYFKNSGNVGIGMTSPSTKLDINAGILNIANSGADGSFNEIFRTGLTGYTGTSNWRNSIYSSVSTTPASSKLKFSLANAQATQADVMTLIGSGNVGIGLTDPGAKLMLADAAYVGNYMWGDSDNSGAEKRAWMSFGQSGTVAAPSISWATGIKTTGEYAISRRTSAWADPADTPSLLINADGNVGIGGITSPGFQLDVYQNLAGNWIARFDNDGNTNDRYGLWVQSGKDDGTGTNYSQVFLDGDGTDVGYITYTGGTVTYGPFTANHDVSIPEADNAAGYPYGTVMCVQETTADPERTRQVQYLAVPCTQPYSPALLGAYAGKHDIKPNLHQVYVLGDGQLLVNNQGGNIHVGERLTSSNQTGIGMKANQAGMIMAIAQEDITFTSSNETKLVAVQYTLDYYSPDTYLTDTGDIQLNSQAFTEDLGDATPSNVRSMGYEVRDMAGNLIETVGTFKDLVVGGVKAALVDTTNLIADTAVVRQVKVEEKLVSPVIETDDLRIQGQSLDAYLDMKYEEWSMNNGNANSDSSHTAYSTPHTSSFGDLLVDGDATVGGKLTTGSLEAEAITSHTAYSQLLTSETATISGELYANSSRFQKLRAAEITVDKIRAESIEGLDAKIARILSSTVSAGTVNTYAYNDTGNEVRDTEYELWEEELDDLLARMGAMEEASVAATASGTWLADGSLTSYPILHASSLDADLGTFNTHLAVLGQATITNLEVTASMNIANSLQFTSNSISVLGGDCNNGTMEQCNNVLYLQPSGSGKLDFLAGALTINENGDVHIKGDLYIAGKTTTKELAVTQNATVSGSLFASLIRPLGKDLTIDLTSIASGSAIENSKLKIENSGHEVASVDASGSAYFARLATNKLELPAQVDSGEIGPDELSQIAKSIGVGKIPVGRTYVVIQAPAVTEDSLIFVTPKTNTSTPIAVTNKTAGQSFIVSTSSPSTRDIHFNWWIIN
jgi:site-specific recombinase XerD